MEWHLNLSVLPKLTGETVDKFVSSSQLPKKLAIVATSFIWKVTFMTFRVSFRRCCYYVRSVAVNSNE
jgi:hypothetical protein